MKAKTGRGFREIVIWVNRITAVVTAVCLLLLFVSSVITVHGNKKTYLYQKTPVERNNTAFEDSSLFSDILQDQIADITRMCVIRNQLETNGSYDGKKIIDISSFANRDDIPAEKNVTAQYYLDDLIKWGNYGFDYETKGNRSELFNRYKTIEGKELKDYATTDEEYKTLVTNLQTTASELFQNYTEYTKYLKKYAAGQTNIVFCYGFKNDDTISYYSNLDKNPVGMSADDITAMFAKYKRFIAYNPDKMQISTNTSLNAQNMRNILMQYEYSFQDDSRIWIGIPDAYGQYGNDDILSEAYKLYSEPEPYFLLWLFTAAVSAVLFVISFLAMTKIETVVIFEGRRASRMEKSGRIWLEVYLLFWILAIVGFVYILSELWQNLNRSVENVYMAAVALGVTVFLFHIIFSQLYLCGIRKIRGGNLFKNSLFYALVKKLKAGFVETYDNGSLVSRTWLPYLLFLCLNLVLVLWDLKGIVIAFIFDMAIGSWLYVNTKEREKIVQGIEKIKSGDFTYKVPVEHLHGDNLILAKSVNSIGASIHKAVETSMKDEKMKADLITNVSHDIKTPLTSIINYVDLIKRENIKDEKIRNYVQVLDTKSQRLKQLTDDLVEVSKITSGNISLQFDRINFVEFINQVFGEFAEKFEDRELTVFKNLPSNPVYVKVDSRHIFRVIENLYNNISKYAMEGTRVYLTMEEFYDEAMSKKRVSFAVKNISAQPLNVSAEELMERFVQGDESRKSEGSGLGLSIAKNLTRSMEGDFELQLDGDLFKVILTFDVMD